MVSGEGCAQSMAFPEVTRVVYAINPLLEVICQLRFPPILRIESEPPATFQELIRNDYPYYACRNSLNLGFGLPPEMAAVFPRELSLPAGHQNHEFVSEDKQWILTLTRESLGLVCKSYHRWEDFRSRMEKSVNLLSTVYSPRFILRIGLRYRNLIRRSQLGLEGIDWSDLLKPWVAGAYASEHTKGDIITNSSQMTINLEDKKGQVLVSCGAVKFGERAEECYLIDADFFTSTQTEASHALERLDFLNAQSVRFFDWCIRERLHDALLGALPAS